MNPLFDLVKCGCGQLLNQVRLNKILGIPGCDPKEKPIDEGQCHLDDETADYREPKNGLLNIFLAVLKSK